MRWEVLEWNRPAIEFYERLGAIFLDDWKAVRIEGDALQRLAGAAGGSGSEGGFTRSLSNEDVNRSRK